MDLSYAKITVGDDFLINHSKINKQDAFELIKQNSTQIIEDSLKNEFSDKCYESPNFEVVKKLLGYEGVFAAADVKVKHFNEDVPITDLNIRYLKSPDANGIVKEVNKYLSRGLCVYIHSYYVMDVDRYIDDELTVQEPWFWYGIGITKK